MTDARRKAGFWRVVAAAASILCGAPGCINPQPSIMGTHPIGFVRPRSNLPKPADATGFGWAKLARNLRHDPIPGAWQWTAAIPTGMPRAELIAPVLARELLAELAPQIPPRITPVSIPAVTHAYLIERIEDEPVKDLASLIMAVDVASQSQVATACLRDGVVSPETPTIPIKLNAQQLLVLSQTSSPEHPVVRMTYADRPSAVIRQGPVQCVVTPRVERERGLLQVALAKRTCWGGSQLLPQELTAACDGTPLRCLTLAQTLDLLYGELARGPRTEAGEDTSFASVSEREDYLIPSNYRKLLQRLEKVHGRSFAKRPRPALVEVPEIEYPGPAVLGDARALAGFLQQREYVQPGEPVQAGWVMFAGDALRDRRQIQLAIDLGQGPLPLEFVLPES